MEKDFWLSRWQKQEIGFHQKIVSVYLQQYWNYLNIPKGATVLVPLCGKSLDMIWLLEQGYQIIGVELSQLAVEAFFDEHSLPYQKTEISGILCFHTNNLTIYCCDFFELPVEFFTQVSAVYDRAALVALPEPLRKNYVDKLKQVLPVTSKLLLVCFSYPQDQMSGPPFSVPTKMVEQYFLTHMQITELLALDILATEPRFQERGVTSLFDKVYLLEPLTKS